MNNIMIEEFDDNEIEVDMSIDPEEQHIKDIIAKGLKDTIDLSTTLMSLLNLAEPFGDVEALNELIIFYGDVVPNILVGDYDSLLEGIDDYQREAALTTFKHVRKEMFARLMDKYED